MTVLRRVTIGLCLSVLASMALAQEAPLIRIAPTAPDASQAPVVQETQSGAAVPGLVVPSQAPTVPAGDSPRIEIAPLVTDPVPAADVPVVPTDVVQDQPAPEPVAVADWRLVLVPAAGFLPTEVRIGSSMPLPHHLRLSGELASADFILTLPEGVTPPTDLLLSLRSSANVLPESSGLTVQVNDVETGTAPLDNIGGFADRHVPVTGLVPGANRIRISVVQTHRIFCGPDASFAVWTEIDLGQSGVAVRPDAVPVTAQGFLAALQSQVADGGALEILTDTKTDAALIRNVANVVSGAIDGAAEVSIQSFYQVEKGSEAKARVALIPAAAPKVSFQRGSGGAIVLQIEFAGAVLPDLAALLPPYLPDAVPTLTPGRATSLSELGAEEILGNTRYFRQDVNFMLPDDWLLLASQKAQFTLHYGFSADLAQGALLLVKVNGKTIRLLPLDREGGKVLPPLDMTFRANGLNPGLNTLTFEMSVPGDPPDLPCTPRRTDMLVILGDSTLTVPPSPSMRQADILHSLAQLGGDGIEIPAEVADPVQDLPTLIAFGSLFRPLTAQAAPVRLHIVGAESAGLVPRGTTDVTRRMLQTAVFAPVVASLPDTAANAIGRTAKFSLADSEGLPTTAAPQPVPDSDTFWQSLGHLWSADGWIAGQIAYMDSQVFPGGTGLAEWLDGKSGLAMVMQLDPTQPDDIWLIAGPDIKMTDLAQQLDRFRRDQHHDLRGQAALLQRDGTWVSWSENRRPELLEPLSLSNLRSVLGNYASWSPLAFTLLTILFALISLIPALIFVLITRRKGSRT